ncbi:MAG: class I SAM-dependent methyltransferase [Flavobacteriales bacterium]
MAIKLTFEYTFCNLLFLNKDKNLTQNKSEVFDAAAKGYDDTFTHSSIGKAQRKRVYHWLKKVDFFNTNNSIFEINCGTGYDAEHFYNKGLSVTATDGSGKMIEVSKKQRNSEIDFFQLGFDEVSENKKFKESNVLFSNFGGLNCISLEELKTFTKGIAKGQKKGDLIAWVIMPNDCFIENFYFLFKGQFRKMFRRKLNGSLKVNVDGVEVETFYHAPNDVKDLLEKYYQVVLKKPVALFIPPSYLEGFFKNKKFLLKLLEFFERIFGWVSFYSNFADHYIIIAKRK